MTRERIRQNIKQTAYLPGAMYERLFDISVTAMASRGVEKIDTEKRIEWELCSFVEKCGDLILKRLSRQYESSDGQSMEQLKSDKTKEEIRKLRIDNDREERSLVEAGEVEEAYSRGMKAVADVLDSTISAVRIACPDLPQSALSAISDALTDARRKSARLEFTDFDGG